MAAVLLANMAVVLLAKVPPAAPQYGGGSSRLGAARCSSWPHTRGSMANTDGGMICDDVATLLAVAWRHTESRSRLGTPCPTLTVVNSKSKVACISNPLPKQVGCCNFSAFCLFGLLLPLFLLTSALCAVFCLDWCPHFLPPFCLFFIDTTAKRGQANKLYVSALFASRFASRFADIGVLTFCLPFCLCFIYTTVKREQTKKL
jgi:hypothetical protein